MTAHGVLRLAAKKKARTEAEAVPMNTQAMQSRASHVQASPAQPDTQQTPMDSDSSLLSSADITAGFVPSNVGEMENIEVTAAMSTANSDEVFIGSSELLKGFRKRWRDRNEMKTASEKDAGSSEFGTIFSDDRHELPELTEGVDSPSSLPVAAVDDDLVHYDDVSDERTVFCIDSEVVETRTTASAPVGDAIRSTKVDVFKFPWEKGRMSRLFSKTDSTGLQVPSFKPGGRNFLSMHVEVSEGSSVDAKIKVKQSSGSCPTFSMVVKKAEDISIKENRLRERDKAIKSWWSLLRKQVSGSIIGRNAEAEVSLADLDEYAMEILEATFAVKSPGTLRRRLYAVQSFSDFCEEKFGTAWLPVDEVLAWKYVKKLQTENAAATKAASFMESLRFCWYLLGVDGADVVEISLRIKGVAIQMKALKRPWKPADVLTLDEVKKLHAVLNDESKSNGDRLFTGHMLHMLYSRSRWSDLLEVGNLFTDSCGMYLELETRSHKGAKTAELKAKLLPIVAPTHGVVDGNWVSTYMQLRATCNMDPRDGEFGPMLPAPADTNASSWMNRAVSSEEGAGFLRQILNQPKSEQRRISSHSLKSTTLSWCCKFGLSESTRAVLARHMSTVANATAVYSRDLLSPVLREYDLMLNAIRCGAFSPDSSRSGMITPGAIVSAAFTPMPPHMRVVPLTPPPATLPARDDTTHAGASDAGWEMVESKGDGPVHVEQDSFFEHSPKEPEKSLEAPFSNLPDSETSEEPSSDSTTDSDATQALEAPDDPEPLAVGRLFINLKTQVLHRTKTDESFQCGRKVTCSYVRVASMNGIRCSRCFNV